MYVLDTNIFIDWWQRWYPTDVFPTLQTKMESLVTAGTVIAPDRVKDEINHISITPLKRWAKQQKVLFVPHDTRLQDEANDIQFTYPALIDTTTAFDEADRWVIALAKMNNCTVVTHETSAKSKRNPLRSMYIPDVCAAMKVPCIGFVEFLRQEKIVI